MNEVKRRLGLEQEFFLVDKIGHLSDRADEFLHNCHLKAEHQGINPNYFVPEFVKSMIEINTSPAYTGTGLAKEYLINIKLALIVKFAMIEASEGGNLLRKLRNEIDHYQTIETEILTEFIPTIAQLSLEAGLQLVRECCDNLETEISWLDTDNPFKELDIEKEFFIHQHHSHFN